MNIAIAVITQTNILIFVLIFFNKYGVHASYLDFIVCSQSLRYFCSNNIFICEWKNIICKKNPLVIKFTVVTSVTYVVTHVRYHARLSNTLRSHIYINIVDVISQIKIHMIKIFSFLSSDMKLPKPMPNMLQAYLVTVTRIECCSIS